MGDDYQGYQKAMYEGSIIQRYVQIKDEEKARKMAEDAEAIQENAVREETERILEKEEVSQEEINKVFDDYGKEDKYKEYLVDGATLKCNKATLRPFELFEMDGVIKILPLEPGADESSDEFEERIYTTLDVSENPISDNGSIYATVKDTVKGTVKGPLNDGNIAPFRCHCQVRAGSPGKLLEILSDPKAREEGVCKHLMELNPEWENLPRKEISSAFAKADLRTSYMKAEDIHKDATVDKNLAVISEGIMMTSILFCKHGGIITPVTSGQTDVEPVTSEQVNMDSGMLTKEQAIEILSRYLQGDYLGELVGPALAYLAQHSSYTLPEYSSASGHDYNQYDTYILGWTEYYIDYYEKKFGADKIYIVDPQYIKSQCYNESRVGEKISTIPVENAQRDIMQALDVRNYTIYDYIDISCSQFVAFTTFDKYWKGTDIWKVNHTDENGVLVDSPPDGSKYSEDKMERCGGLIAALFTTNEDGTGDLYHAGSNYSDYYYQHERVTPVMSLAVGMDKMWEEMQNSHGDYRAALIAYNGSGNKEAYAEDIIGRVIEPESIDNLE